MGNKKNKSSDSSIKTNAKLDKLLEKFEESEKKAVNRHEEIRKELKTIERKHAKLQKEVKKCKKREQDLEIELSRMNEIVNSLDQDKLSKNLVFKGIKEVSKESDSKFTHDLVQFLVNHMFKSSGSINVIAARRIGFIKDKNKPQARPIVAQFDNSEVRMRVLKAAKEASLNCDLILTEDGPIGTVEDKIYVNEHLTHLNTKLFYEARKLKREKHVQFAWVKNGAVLVKKSGDSNAIRLKRLNHLCDIKGKFGIKSLISSTIIDIDSGSSSESESDETAVDDENGSSSSETATEATTPSKGARGQKRKSTPKADERESRRTRRAATSRNLV